MRSGMTLFEVAISMLLMATVCIAALALFPTGLRVNGDIRLQLLAASRFQMLLSTFDSRSEIKSSREARDADGVPFLSARAWAPDLEGAHVVGPYLRPIPRQIAQRIDSDGDEIAALLAAGGDLYYLPLSDSQLATSDSALERQLVVGILGYPQLNTMTHHPQIRWPYYDSIPNPLGGRGTDPNSANPPNGPIPGGQEGTVLKLWFKAAGEAPGAIDPALLEAARKALSEGWRPADDPLGPSLDPWIHPYDFVFFFNYWGAHRPGVQPPDDDGPNPHNTRRRLKRFEALFAAMLDPNPLNQPGFDPAAVPTRDQLDGISTANGSADPAARREGALRVNALATLLSGYAYCCGLDARSAGTATGWPDANPAISRFQEAAAWAETFHRYLQLHHIGDLRVQRPEGRPLMTDHLLLQHDVLGTPLATPGPGKTMHAWNILTGVPIVGAQGDVFTNVLSDWSAPISPPVHAGIPASAAADRWHLTKAFTGNERCRQVAFWAVDWMDYRDFEEARGAPMDAARCYRAPTINAATAAAGRAGDVHQWGGWSHVSLHRIAGPHHPEFYIAWRDRLRTQVTLPVSGSDPRPAAYQNPEAAIERRGGNGLESNPDLLPAYIGALHGADRNGNGRLDHGNTDPGVRMRARPIARFNVYDPVGFIPKN